MSLTVIFVAQNMMFISIKIQDSEKKVLLKWKIYFRTDVASTALACLVINDSLYDYLIVSFL